MEEWEGGASGPSPPPSEQNRVARYPSQAIAPGQRVAMAQMGTASWTLVHTPPCVDWQIDVVMQLLSGSLPAFFGIVPPLPLPCASPGPASSPAQPAAPLSGIVVSPSEFVDIFIAPPPPPPAAGEEYSTRPSVDTLLRKWCALLPICMERGG